MTVILSNLATSAATYRPTQIAVSQTKTETFSAADQPVSNEVANSAFEPDVLMQNVLQSLKTLGVQGVVDTYSQELSPQASQALQFFVKELYQAINPELPREALPIETVANTEIDSNPLLIGGTNFKYAVDLNEAELGDYSTDVKTNLKMALEDIGKYISSKVVFNLKVVTESVEDNRLASANSTVITTRKESNEESLDTSFVSDSMYGVELSPEIPDSKLYINLAKMADMSFSGKPEPDKYDFTTVLTHEILHGIAFAGMLNTDYPSKTGFDELVTMTESGPVFTGRHARTENNGNPVPLAPASAGQGSSFYHVAIPDDLMAHSIKKGEVKKISPLDVAMLQDIGVGIVNANSVDSNKVQNAYGSPSVNLQNLINTIQQTNDLEENFSNLVQALDSSNAYSDVNLHDFLSQLATTTQNESDYQSPVGSLVSFNA